jgi:hypothetical protein
MRRVSWCNADSRIARANPERIWNLDFATGLLRCIQKLAFRTDSGDRAICRLFGVSWSLRRHFDVPWTAFDVCVTALWDQLSCRLQFWKKQAYWVQVGLRCRFSCSGLAEQPYKKKKKKTLVAWLFCWLLYDHQVLILGGDNSPTSELPRRLVRADIIVKPCALLHSIFSLKLAT